VNFAPLNDLEARVDLRVTTRQASSSKAK